MKGPLRLPNPVGDRFRRRINRAPWPPIARGVPWVSVMLASLLPARGQVAVGFGWLTKIVIAILFFLHGAKLSREAVVAGLGHWRFHLLVLASTFVLFPILGFASTFLPASILPPAPRQEPSVGWATETLRSV